MMDQQDHNKHSQEELRQLPQRFCCHQYQEKTTSQRYWGYKLEKLIKKIRSDAEKRPYMG